MSNVDISIISNLLAAKKVECTRKIAYGKNSLLNLLSRIFVCLAEP
jgi:hypothetical protein